MEVTELVEYINQKHHTEFQLIKKFSDGTRGAYELEDRIKGRAVLKYSLQAFWINQLRRVYPLIQQMHILNYPTPEMWFIGVTEDDTSYCVQKFVKGTLLKSMTNNHTKRLIEINRLQANQSHQNSSNWSEYVYNVVYANASGWSNLVKSYSFETNALIACLESLVLNYKDIRLPETDIVHGDFLIDNILEDNGEIVAVIDFEAAGYGSRVIDLVHLLAWSYDDLDTGLKQKLFDEMLSTVDASNVMICAAYEIISMLAYMIKVNNQEGIVNSMHLSRDLLIDVQRLLG